jgi:hypothetical protein
MFAAEERRCWRLAERDMAANERVNLEAAFSLQLRRVEAEWGAHEQQMAADYVAQKDEIEGRLTVPAAVDKAAALLSPAAGPWRNKEKQSRLIHTAPVHSPGSPTLRNAESPGSRTPLAPGDRKRAANPAYPASTAVGGGDRDGGGGRPVEPMSGGGEGILRTTLDLDDEEACSLGDGSGGSGRGGTPTRDLGRRHASVSAQMELLEGAYSSAQARVKHQKANAVRWITRQSSRMGAQVSSKKGVPTRAKE